MQPATFLKPFFIDIWSYISFLGGGIFWNIFYVGFFSTQRTGGGGRRFPNFLNLTTPAYFFKNLFKIGIAGHKKNTWL